MLFPRLTPPIAPHCPQDKVLNVTPTSLSCLTPCFSTFSTLTLHSSRAESVMVPLTYQAPSSPRPPSQDVPPAWHILPSLGKLLVVFLISLAITASPWPSLVPKTWSVPLLGAPVLPHPHSRHCLYFVVISYSGAWLSHWNVPSGGAGAMSFS